ncbi:MAG: hypothetical protein IPL71_12805 [Anaerolineales bacterium]|uniref:hypothetical protein n=1 Tax=Candidatus Villigracilis proximus TaxID=3140683 RepID=UPI003136847E|nr:hypothetical protein [Anaerolineales bacterium]
MTDTISAATYCYVHPDRETSLRCKRCEKPICASCAQRTPTGYMCRDCVRSHQKSFDTSEWYDYIFGFLTAGFLSAVTSFLITLIGGIGFIGWFLILSAAPIAGTTIAESVRVVTRRHRSRSLFITVAVGMVLGALPMLIVQLLNMNIFGIAFQGIYLFIAVPLVYTRLSGIQLFK